MNRRQLSPEKMAEEATRRGCACSRGGPPCLVHFAQLDDEDRHAWLSALRVRDPVENRRQYAAKVGEERRERRLARGR